MLGPREYRCQICGKKVIRPFILKSTCKLCGITACRDHMVGDVCIKCSKVLPDDAKGMHSKRKMLDAAARDQGVDLGDKKFVPTMKLRKKLMEHGSETDQLLGYKRLKEEAKRAESREEYDKAIDLYTRCLSLIPKDDSFASSWNVKNVQKRIDRIMKKHGDMVSDDVKPPVKPIGYGEFLLSQKKQNVQVIKCSHCGALVESGERPVYCKQCGKQVL